MKTQKIMARVRLSTYSVSASPVSSLRSLGETKKFILRGFTTVAKIEKRQSIIRVLTTVLAIGNFRKPT